MEGNKTILTDPDGGKVDEYRYNRCYWSHDAKEGRKLFSNKDLFEDVGNEILGNAWDGYNATIFAYGQTGAGKSYSIEGAPGDPGLLQMMCEEIFNRKTSHEEKGEGNQIKVTVSYLEIYNEKLRDLLDADDGKSLKIYATKKQGIYVKNLEKIYCGDFAQVEKLLSEGKKMRVVGSTQMNKQSSRSHAVFTVYLSIHEVEGGGKKKVKNSEIHIVDLAGSER